MAVKVITYDVGTTGMKACLFDISAEESVKFIAGETDGYELHVMPNGGVEQDPEDWWQAIRLNCSEILSFQKSQKRTAYLLHR
jgi:xylulokinase